MHALSARVFVRNMAQQSRDAAFAERTTLGHNAEDHDSPEKRQDPGPHRDPEAPAPVDPKDATPKLSSFIVTLFYSVLTVTSFTIALPTSTQYMESFGVSDALVGVLVGLTPICSGLMQPVLIPVLKTVPMKRLLLLFCGVNMLANALYALGALTGWVGTVLLARCLMGTVGGPTIQSGYVVRSVGLHHRSKYMLRVGIGIAFGYAAGPLLAILIEVLCGAFGWNYTALSSDTAPGWVMLRDGARPRPGRLC